MEANKAPAIFGYNLPKQTTSKHFDNNQSQPNYFLHRLVETLSNYLSSCTTHLCLKDIVSINCMLAVDTCAICLKNCDCARGVRNLNSKISNVMCLAECVRIYYGVKVLLLYQLSSPSIITFLRKVPTSQG
jgi:hypothetical protein